MPALPPSASRRRILLAAAGVLALCRPAAADGSTDFVKAALAHGGFKAFIGLVSRAGLADRLGISPVTVFMPTDAAFARLSAVQRKSIADLDPDAVKSFVGRFVFPGSAMASNDIDKTITSENGTVYDVTWYKGRLSLRDDRGPATSRLAYVVEGDIPAGSGLIDAVDAVLMPAASGGLAAPVAGAAGPPPTTPAPSLPAPPDTPASPPAKPDAAAPPAAAPAHPESTGVTAPAAAPALPGPAAAPSQPEASRPTPPELPQQAVPEARSTASDAVPAPANPQPRAPGSASTASATVSAPVRPEISVAAAGLRGWPLKVSGSGSTGKVESVMVGLPDGRITGVTAHFGGFLGFGGRSVYVPWDRVAPDATAHVLRARMTAAEFATAPARPPKP